MKSLIHFVVISAIFAGTLFSGCSGQEGFLDVVDEPEGSLLPDMIWAEGVEWYESYGYEDMSLLADIGNYDVAGYNKSIFDNPIVRFLIIKYRFKSETIDGRNWLRAYIFSTDGTKSSPTKLLVRLEGSRVYAFFESMNKEFLIRDFRQYVNNGILEVLKLTYSNGRYETSVTKLALKENYRTLIGEGDKHSVDVFIPELTSWKCIKYIGPTTFGLGEYFGKPWDGIMDGYPRVGTRILQIRNDADGYGVLYQDADYDKIWERRGAGGGDMINDLDQ